MSRTPSGESEIRGDPAGRAGSGSVPRRWRALLRLLRLLPQGALSRAWGRLARTRWPRPVQTRVNRAFARMTGVRLDEAEAGPEAYPTLSGFFVRRLREGARSWPSRPGVPGSPVDGILGTSGWVREGRAIQAKGIDYSVEGLLAGVGRVRDFEGALFVTFYLSPRHYHRIHAPVDGSLFAAGAVPGRLLPVNPPAVRAVRDLFPRNERLVALLDRGGRRIAVVAVGAYNVGRISAAFDPGWGDPDGVVTNRRRCRKVEVRRYVPPLPVSRGEELMAFHLGSTVVLLLGPGAGGPPALRPGLCEGSEVRLGEALLEGSLPP